MIETTCKTCGSTFEAKSGNARFCSKACRPTAAQQRKLKEKTEREERKRKEREEKEWLEKEMAFQLSRNPDRDPHELRKVLRDWFF